jgi:hypothetical protein
MDITRINVDMGWLGSVRSVIAFLFALTYCLAFLLGAVPSTLFSDTVKTVVIFYFVKNALRSGEQNNGGVK